MNLGLSMYGEVRLKMEDYLTNTVSYFYETIQGIVATPAADHLFKVREDADRKLLGEYWSTAFQHSSAQLLFYTPHVRKDIQKSVAFLTTRVRTLNKDEWRKLR